jgi:hypothetical protein
MAGGAELAQVTHELETAIAGARSADAAGDGPGDGRAEPAGEPYPQAGWCYG